MAFMIDYDTVLGILAIMQRTMGDMEDALEEFAVSTGRYNATMQDQTAQEATTIVNEMRRTIEQTKAQIEQSAKRLQQGAAGLKGVEERVRDGGLRG